VKRERNALAVLALVAAGAVTWLAYPFITALVLGALLAFSLEPAALFLARVTRKPRVAALLVVGASGVAIVGAFSAFISVFVARSVELTNAARQDLQNAGPLSHAVATASQWLARVGVAPAELHQRVQESVGSIAARAGSFAAALAASTFAIVLGLLFALLTMYAVLRHWDRISTSVVAASPLQPTYTEQLLEQLRTIGRTTLSGTVLTGVTQGALAAIGYWITGVPYPAFFGITTAFASLVPAVGTLPVWVPAGLYLIAKGHRAAGIVELAWGALVVVAISDYVIRPRMVSEETMPPLLVFIALFGGLEMMGLDGLIVGPVVMGLALAILRLYANEQRSARNIRNR
jgi:predicted PurR-regulated permease PerM